MDYIEIDDNLLCSGLSFIDINQFDRDEDIPIGSVRYDMGFSCYYVMTEKGWERLTDSFDSSPNKMEHPRICHQCGAPLVGHKCEYCGTEYEMK